MTYVGKPGEIVLPTTTCLLYGKNDLKALLALGIKDQFLNRFVDFNEIW
jgi:hypothetical protein